MKKIYLLLLVLITCLLSCNRKNDDHEISTIILDENSVTAFAEHIEQSLLNGDPELLNKAFDRDYLKSIIRDNSIVNSSLDADFGQEYFDDNFHLGNELCQYIDNGGDVKFVRYYIDNENNAYHIVFRSYHDFILNFYDFQVDTLQDEIVIKDGFVYNTACLFSDNIRENVLLNVLYRTNPEGVTKVLGDLKMLTDEGKAKEAMIELKAHKEELKNLSVYWQFYIVNLFKTSDKYNFIEELDSLRNQGVDERMLLLHKLMFQLNEGRVEANESTINELINHTGDDPIYLLFFGKTLSNAHRYEEAATCYETASEYLPPLWDLWHGTLECYHHLGEKEKFEECLAKGKDNYGMSDDELEEVKAQLLR
ncbi:MAG: hypothetical protein MJZ72_08305 [Bacteroidales bacterium]|nr:hypothetical protein [Bacteroidales bacterium]